MKDKNEIGILFWYLPVNIWHNGCLAEYNEIRNSCSHGSEKGDPNWLDSLDGKYLETQIF